MSEVERTTHPVADARLSVLTAGAGDPIVLLHGIPASAELWRDLLGLLAQNGCHGLAPDLPGYGATRLPASADHSLAGSAQLLAAWLVQSAQAPAWVVGHDAGGAVAQLLAARHPHTVSRLTLVNSIVDGSWPAPRARLGTLGARLGLVAAVARPPLVPNAYMRRQVASAFADPAAAHDADLDRVVWDTKFSSPGGRAAFQRHLAALTPRDTAEIVPDLKWLPMPCQLVWGMADPFQRWATAGARLRTLLPPAAVTRLDACGHFAPLECPDSLLEAMLDWRASG